MEGLFLDVPYILDSLFRWTEFHANRIGRIDVSQDSPDWVTTTGWRSPAFWLYAMVSVFLAFGPTFDSLCGLLGAKALLAFWHGLAYVVLGFIILVAFRQLWRMLQHLTRRLRTNAATFNSGSTPTWGKWGGGLASVTRNAYRSRSSKALSLSGLQVLRRLLSEFFAQTGMLNSRGHRRFLTAYIALVVVTSAVFAPIGLLYLALTLAQIQPATVCRAGTPWPVVAQLVTLAVWVGAGAWIWSTTRLRSQLQRLTMLTALWLLGLTYLWGFVGTGPAMEGIPGPYRHLYAVVIATLLGFAFFAYWFAGCLFGHPRRVWYREYADPAGHRRRIRVSWRRMFRDRLATVDLLDDDRSDPQLSRTRIFGALVNGIGQQPLQFLLLPAFVALMWPAQQLFTYTIGAAVVSAIALAWGSLAERWQQIITYVNRWYLVGIPLPLSMLVIVLALLRLLNVQYVSTVLDAAPLGTVVLIVVMSYVAAWFYEYWVNRWPAERLLNALAFRIKERGKGWIPIDAPAASVTPAGTAQPSPRRCGVHGTGRFCVQGWYTRTNPAPWEQPRAEVFSTFDLVSLFEALAMPGDGMAHRAVSSLRRRLRLYFYTLNALLVVAVIGLWKWHAHLSAPAKSEPVVTASLTSAPAPAARSLSERLLASAKESRPAVIVAASGGGTRAALYTAHALEGLARLDRARDVVLISGVSGGGLTSALFAARATQLQSPESLQIAPGRTQSSWQDLKSAAIQPFIADVFEGAGELRIASSTPLGKLLAESFARRSFHGRDVSFGSLNGPALILNTAVSGHPSDESRLLEDRTALGLSPGKCTTLSSLAGSRLIFTNLPEERMQDAAGQWREQDSFPGNTSELPDVRLDYTVVRDPTVLLSAATALNANFPPVFPNARVELAGGSERCPVRSFYVTDGGATENLGLVSALYALQGALDAWPQEQQLPPIHVMAIEASAVSYDYSQDRGLGAATGGSKERINGALTDLLLERIRQRMSRLGGSLQLHYLPLPVAFRSRGGFGTHWMYASEFRVTNPFLTKVPNRFMTPIRELQYGFSHHETIGREDLARIWNGLFQADAGFCDARLFASDIATLTRKGRQVRAWICGHVTTDDVAAVQDVGIGTDADSRLGRLLLSPKKPDYLIEAWQGVVTQLGPRAPENAMKSAIRERM